MSIEKNNYRNGEQDRRLNEMEKSIKTINSEMGDVKVSVAGIEKTQAILMMVNLAILGSLVALFLK